MKTKTWLIITTILLLTIGVLIGVLHSKNDTLTITSANLEAAMNKIEVVELQNKDLLYSRNSYIASANELQRYLDISKSEITDLKKKLGEDIQYIASLEERIALDTVVAVTDTVYISNGITTYNWRVQNQWYDIRGTSSNHTILTKTEFLVPLKVGLTESWEIFVTSENPYVSFTSINGAVLNKDDYLHQSKKNRWNLGISVGLYGGYDLLQKNIYIGPGIGLGLTYNIF